MADSDEELWDMLESNNNGVGNSNSKKSSGSGPALKKARRAEEEAEVQAQAEALRKAQELAFAQAQALARANLPAASQLLTAAQGQPHADAQAKALAMAQAQSACAGQPARQLGRIRWYNGRKQVGMVLGDDGRELFVPTGGALNGNQVPLTPAGLMHGTRVSYIPVSLGRDSGVDACRDVQPADASQLGIECGVETRIGGREENQDRIAAADLADIGFLAGVFDGHGGTTCADFVSQSFGPTFHNVYTARAQKVQKGVSSLTPSEEVNLISEALKDSFGELDNLFIKQAEKQGLKDGSTAVVTLLVHGFQASMAEQTVAGAPGGVAKLFVAWCGDSRAVLVRGTRAVRLSQDHKPDRKDELHRIGEAGGVVGVDANGLHRVGTKKQVSGLNWLSTSRSFGDLNLKVPDPLVIAEPELIVRTLVPEDWAVVLCCDGITDVCTNQEIADVCWNVMVKRGLGPVDAAKEIAGKAEGKGSTDNLTVFVIRLGWAMPKGSKGS